MFWSKFKRLWARIFRRVDENPVVTPINQKVDDGPANVVSGQPVKGTTEVAGSHGDSLQPTAQKVMQRFRILLLGKSGAGKSSLIENIMKIPEIDVARYRAGAADINMELKSDENPHFVLHDSMGYESGSREHFQVVKDFIEKRSKQSEISEQIHAIWLCTKVQSTGGRIFETGDETLLQMNLGRVPLIIVFTQYDELVDHEELQLLQKRGLNQNANDNAEKQFNLTCIRPLKDICKRNGRDTPPHLKVSVRPNYENTLQKLAQLTKETLGSVDNQLDADQPTTSTKNHGPVWITWAMAQRVDADLNLEASIAIGKKEFWKYLGSSFYFGNRTLATCLDTLHDDIILVWNFYDPEKRLTSDDFKKRMRASISDLVSDIAADSGTTPRRGISAAPPVPRGAEIIASLQTVEPLTKWTHNIYDKSPGVVRCLMAYIVNLTLVMQQLFSETRPLGKTPSLSVDLLHKVLKQFQDSTPNQQVHDAIRSFVKEGYDIVGENDEVLEEMLRLIKAHRGQTGKGS